ncbi:hypothetical protein GT347_21910 [Xylophilus rhododendri]|uniref:Uncharacterized protein n=1 Tax=Xylophilus rhododendri TaxID=2697032 RepID=A0A857JCD5_9BURK|nr:hypothetical protein [Xylophilus rhododendri]QHJ00399.1 hypothetical protein GT347_21910 [Xylophilus rhododendri]
MKKQTTSVTPEPTPSQTPDQVQALLREINVLASNAIQLALQGTGEEEDKDQRILLLRQAMERVGWIADVALRRLGEPGAFESAEDWMLAHV